MTEYLLINTLISTWALFSMKYLLPHAKHQFGVLTLALVCWLVPFGWFRFQAQSTLMETTHTLVDQITSPLNQAMTPQPGSFSWPLLMASLMIVGGLRFLVDLWQLDQQDKQLKSQGQATEYPHIYTVENLNNACVTGLKTNSIWVDENLFHSPAREAILAHEQQHIKNKDPYWLLLTVFIQRIFWFNPLVWLLAHQNKQVIEKRCDQACSERFPSGHYAAQLANSLLIMNEQKSSLSNFMSQDQKHSLQRIQTLNKEKIMNKTQLILTALFATTITMASAAVLAKSQDAQAANHVQLQVNWKFWSHEAGIDQTSEVDSVITVNDQSFTTFGPGPNQPNGYQLKVKAQKFNPEQEPESYLILTEIIHPKAFQDKKPAVATLVNRPAVIRMIDDSLPELHQVELTFTPLAAEQ